jgi:hypothetical protein
MSLALGSLGEPELPVLSSMTEDLTNASNFVGQGAAASAVYPTANLAIFVPVRLSQPRTYVKAWWLNGATAAGNVDVGIYTLSGTTLTRVVASTAEAQAGVSAMQVAAAFTTTTIGPGVYYLAISCTLGTATFWRSVASVISLRTMGCFQAATSSPLPATATAAVITNAYLPIFGFSELATV